MSLGTIQFALGSGGPLFPVNRDDDLNDADTMAALHDWDETKRLPKLLSAIENPLVKDLLTKLLAADPAKRPESMEVLLEHPFFVDRAATHAQIEQIQASLSRIETIIEATLQNTKEITLLCRETSQKMDRCTSTLLTAIVEVGDIVAPARRSSSSRRSWGREKRAWRTWRCWSPCSRWTR